MELQAPDPRLLSTKNPHPNDGRVTFKEEGHKYTHSESGRLVPKSQTGATGRFFETFDAKAVVDANFATWRANKECKYWPLIHYIELVERKGEDGARKAIIQLWEANGQQASRAGTHMHEQIENYLNGLLVLPVLPGCSESAPAPMGVSMVQGFLKWFYPEQKLEPWRVEFSVCVEVPVDVLKGKNMEVAMLPAICGNIDAIFRSQKDGRYWIFDWKRVDPSKGLLGKQAVGDAGPGHKRRRSPDMATGFFQQWEASNFNKYSAQLHGYRWQLIEGGYFKPEEIAGCFLVQMHDLMPKAHVVEAADLQDEVDAAMRAEVDAAKESYYRELEPSIQEVPDEVAWSIKC